MARGGKRVGAGRKMGSATKRTREIADRAAAEGVMPLDVMLDNMKFYHERAGDLLEKVEVLFKDGTQEDGVQAALILKGLMDNRQAAQVAARDAAPYCHSRFSSVEHTGEDGGPIQVTWLPAQA